MLIMMYNVTNNIQTTIDGHIVLKFAIAVGQLVCIDGTFSES